MSVKLPSITYVLVDQENKWQCSNVKWFIWTSFLASCKNEAVIALW